MAGKFDPNTAQNAIEIEKQFAVKAVEQAQIYWNLLAKVEPSKLRLTKLDDEIYEDTLATFPDLAENDHAKLRKIDEEWLKSAGGKKQWHKFITKYEKKVGDYNFGCLIRTDAGDEYSEKNTIFVTRMQFYAIEIARNRLGLNEKAHELAKEENEKEEAAKKKASKS